MIKRLCSLMFALFLVFGLGVAVSADTYKNGEVLYHQDFSVFPSTHIGTAGIRKGTNSSSDSALWLSDGALNMITNDDLRTYALLPEIPWTDSYTIEFTFCMNDIRSNRGYLAFLLTCWGDEPSNITSLVIRADGTIDDFAPLSEELAEKMQNGEQIHVEIPIENGVLHEVTLTAGKTVCTVKRNSLKRITAGNRGFGVRKLTASIGEVYVVNGVGYTAKTGEFAKSSWSDDPANLPLDEAPPTGEPIGLMVGAGLGAGFMVWTKRTKKRR